MDNKYANLPGIAKNEPDSYETQNVTSHINVKPEASEDDSSNVQKINISTKEAHEKFNKKILSSDFADFSDSVTNRRKFGYVFEPETFEWNQDPVESPLQRFKRLEAELNELKLDLNEMEKNINDDDKLKLSNFEPASLLGEVENLQKQINSLHLKSIGANKNVADLDSKAKKQLLVDHLNEMKKNLDPKQGNKEKRSDKQEDSIVFKLFTDLEKSELDRANRISELNQRLSNLEKVFGAGNASVNESQIAKLCTNIENKTILGLIENLNSKISLVDAQSIDVVESRLQTIAQRVTQLNEKKTLIEDHEKLNRVNELYSLLCKWKDMSSVLPSIMERLTMLDEIHKKAFEFASMLSRLDNEQESIKKSVETGIVTLEKLKKQFEINWESIKSDFETLNQRILSIEVKK